MRTSRFGDSPNSSSTRPRSTREVPEGKKGATVGARVTATSNHGHAVNYTLVEQDGDDNAKFKIDQKTGQITTGVKLDYEAALRTTDDNCEALERGA